MEKRRGQISIITIVLFILISLVAIVILWNVVHLLVQKSSQSIEIDKFSIKLSPVQTINLNNCTQIQVQRNSAEGNISGILFNFKNDSSSVSIKVNDSSLIPNPLETKFFMFCYPDNLSVLNPSSLSVVPVFNLNGEESYGVLSQESVVSNQNNGNNINPTCNCTNRCGNFNICSCGSCSGLKLVCNSSNYCDICHSNADCSSGICNSSGQCVNPFSLDKCTIINSPGNYELSRDLIENSVVLPAGSASCFNMQSSDILLDCKNHKILNNALMITGVFSEYTKNISVINCNISLAGLSRVGINFSYVNNSVIQNNILSRASIGIATYYANNSKIIENKLYHIGQGDNLYSFGGGIYSENLSNSYIENNLLFNIISSSFPAIYLNQNFNISIKNNIINQSQIHGFYFSNLLNSSVINNTIVNISGDGIYFANGPVEGEYNQILNNQIKFCDLHGIYINTKNETLIGNNVSNCNIYGIYIGMNGRGIVIRSNKICNNVADIFCSSQSIPTSRFIDNNCIAPNPYCSSTVCLSC